MKDKKWVDCGFFYKYMGSVTRRFYGMYDALLKTVYTVMQPTLYIILATQRPNPAQDSALDSAAIL